MRAARIDANHRAIVDALVKTGAQVQSLAAVGDGVADLLVYVPRLKRLLLLEIKDSNKPPSARKLTPAQVAWHARFPVHVVTSLDEALAAAYGWQSKHHAYNARTMSANPSEQHVAARDDQPGVGVPRAD